MFVPYNAVAVYLKAQIFQKTNVDLIHGLLTVTSVNMALFWAVTRCSSQTARHFGGTYRLHFQA
jgi:hypothetical protein